MLLTRLEAENDVIVDFGGIPPLMPEATFKVQFGDVDSSRYKALLSEIEDRIKKLGLYEAR